MNLYRAWILAVTVGLCALEVICATKSSLHTNSDYYVAGEHVPSSEKEHTGSLSASLPVKLILMISSFLMNTSATPSMVANKKMAVWILCNCAFVHDNFPVSIFPEKLKLRECLSFWKTASDIVPNLRGKRIKLPKYCALLGDIRYSLAQLETDFENRTSWLLPILWNLSIPYAMRRYIANQYFCTIPVEKLAHGEERMFKIVSRFINDHEHGEIVYRVAMTQQGSCQADTLGYLMAFSAPIDYFSKLGTIFDRSQALIGFLEAPVISYSDKKRREIHDRNKNLINRYFTDYCKGLMEDINSIRFANLDMVPSVKLCSHAHNARAHYYALIYSCHWDRPELFAAWSKLLSAVPSISELEHELIFEKKSLSGYENCVDNPIISDILESFDVVTDFVFGCPSEAFLSLWYSIVKINAINNKLGALKPLSFLLAFSLAKTVEDKELFASRIVERIPDLETGELCFLPYDPIFIKQVLSHPKIQRKSILAYFAYSVMHNIPELVDHIFRIYGKTAAERRRLCEEALKSGLIPPALRPALLKAWVYSHLPEYFAAFRESRLKRLSYMDDGNTSGPGLLSAARKCVIS